MFDPKEAQDMAKKFVNSLHPDLAAFKEEIEKNLRQFLLNCFQNMQLVTREEFDIQTQVLAKTREKLENLEAQLKTLIDSAD